MTVKEVAIKFGVTEQTVKEWCKNHYIRGVEIEPDTGEYIIPASVKRPYTRKGTPKGDAIYTSIVKATLYGLDVCAELYNMDPAEFDKYINELKNAGVIDTYISKGTGIEYFCKTLESSNFSKLPKNKIKNDFASMKPDIKVNVGVNVL